MWALVFALISTIFAVTLQFFKGSVLDSAAAGEAGEALRYGTLLAAFILGEVLCFFCDKRPQDNTARRSDADA